MTGKIIVPTQRQLIENQANWRDARYWEKFRPVWGDDGGTIATRPQGTAEESIAMNK